MDISEVILYLNNILLVICVLVGIIKYRSFKNTEKWYVYYIIFLFLIECAIKTAIYGFHAKELNHIFPYYVSGELLILGTLFIRKLKLSAYLHIPLVLMAGFFLFSTDIIVNETKKVISSIVIICFAGYALLMEINNPKINARFIVADSLIFLYYGMSVFMFFVLGQLAYFKSEDANMIWNVNNLLCSLLYVSLIYTFLKLKK